MKKFFFCLLLLNFQNVHAQVLEWFEGSLVLSTGEVLTGETAMNAEHDIILFQRGGSRMVYPAHRVQAVYFYDTSAEINRRYVSLKVKTSGRRPGHQLFEIVIKGEVSVVRRKKESAFSTHTNALDFSYFILYNNELTALKMFNRKIFPQLISTADKRLEKFMSMNRLSSHDAANTLQIVKYYNSLVKADEFFAQN